MKEFLIITTPLAYLNDLAFYVVHYVIYLLYGSLIITLGILYQCFGIVPAIHGIILYVLFLTAMMSYSYMLSVCFQKGWMNYLQISFIIPPFFPTIIYIIFKIFILIQKYCTYFLAVFYAKTCGFILHFLPFLVFNLLPTNLFYISTYLFSFNTFQDAWDLIQIISNKCKLLIRRNYYLK